MAYEQKDGDCVLFKNDKKETEKHPDYKGWGVVNGTPVWLAAWIKSGPRGKFMSLSIKPKDEAKRDEKPTTRRESDFPDSIPF